MTKEEMINKLKTIKPTAFPTVGTDDMGIQFDVVTPDGAYTYFGGIGEWPVWFFDRLDNEHIENIKQKLKNRKKVTFNDFQGTDIFSFAKRLEIRNEVDLSKTLKDIVNYPISDDKKKVYIFGDIGSYEPELSFFDTEEEIVKYFFNNFPGSNSWESLDEVSISVYLREVEDHGEGLRLNSSDNIMDD